MKVTLNKITNNLQGTNSGGDEAENQINDLEHKEEKSIQSEQQEEKRIKKNEYSIRSLQDISKCTNIQIIGVPDREEEEQEIENLFEKIMKENFPNLVKEIDIRVQEGQRVSNKLDPKRPTPRHVINKMPKFRDKERILKAAREQQLVTYRGFPMRLSTDFSKETMQARRDWQEIFKVTQSRDLQPRLLYPGKLSLRIEGQINIFTEKKKLKEFITTKPVYMKY